MGYTSIFDTYKLWAKRHENTCTPLISIYRLSNLYISSENNYKPLVNLGRSIRAGKWLWASAFNIKQLTKMTHIEVDAHKGQTVEANSTRQKK